MSNHDAIQPTDDSPDSIAATMAARVKHVRDEAEREQQAYVRELIRTIESYLTGAADPEAEETDLGDVALQDLLQDLEARLQADSRIDDVLGPGSDCPTWDRSTFRRAISGGRVQNTPRRFQAAVHVARELGYLSSFSDKTSYAPVKLGVLDVPGASSRVEEGEQTPIGRRRLPADTTLDLDDARVEIPHKDCEHIAVIANPRQGKDSTIARICGNLKHEHGYKWVSLYDDGRNETPMLALPNGDPAIQENLEQFGQTPTGYDTTVYVPAVDDLLDRLPSNHEPFSIGIDALSPSLIADLAGESIASEATERRIRKALAEARDGDGSVETLIDKLQTYANETTAEVQVKALRDDDDLDEDADEDDAVHSYEMGEDDLLAQISESLMLLAAEGLLRDEGVETNLDMVDVIADQESVAVLNANFVSDSLKLLLTDLWLQLIYQARDDHPRLPRVALEVRELKNLAPSKLGDSSYSHIVKSLRQTFFFLSSQGGSRRIMILGSTQKLNDVYKSVRGNMPIKILLKLGQEKITTLNSAGFHIQGELQDQLESFQTGWGMIFTEGQPKWPIQWCGARCALGLGDIPWRDRYGEAAGFRVGTRSTRVDAWLDVTGERVTDRQPEPGEWYLLPDDVDDHGGFEDALAARSSDAVKSDLRLTEVDVEEEARELELLSQQESRDRKLKRIRDQYDFPETLEPWLDCTLDQIDRMLDVLRAIRDGHHRNYASISEASGVGKSTISNYKNRNEGQPLDGLFAEHGDVYALTPPGRQALELPWRQFL